MATLYSYLDGELTPDRRLQIQHHLDECAPCFQAFDFESELKALIARSAGTRCRRLYAAGWPKHCGLKTDVVNRGEGLWGRWPCVREGSPFSKR